MTGSNWWNAALALLSVVTSGYFVVRGVVRPAGREVWGHALVGLGMAGMFSPWGDPVPLVVGAVVFALLTAWFAAARLSRPGTGIDASAHLAIGTAAMVLMYVGYAGVGAGGLHHEHVSPAGSVGLLAVGVNLLVAGYFGWHAWEVIGHPDQAQFEDEARTGGTDVGGDGTVPVRERRGLRAEPLAHATMSGLMALMFLPIL